MLDWHIQVMAYFFVPFYGLDQLTINFLWITVQDADPLDPWDFIQFIQQLMQGFLPIQVHAIQRCLLRHQDQFFYPLACKFFCLRQKLFHRDAAVTAADFWDNAVCAAFIAPFCNFQMGIMPACGQGTPGIHLGHRP